MEEKKGMKLSDDDLDSVVGGTSAKVSNPNTVTMDSTNAVFDAVVEGIKNIGKKSKSDIYIAKESKKK